MNRLRELLIRWKILPRDERPPLGRYVLRHLPALAVIFILTLLAEKFGVFSGRVSFALDVLLAMRVSGPAKDVVLITIDEDEYNSTYQGTSPLDAEKLRELLELIELGQPRLIAVDLDSSHESFELGKEAGAPLWPNAVWVRAAKPSRETDNAGAKRGSRHPLETIHAGSVLGRQPALLPSDAEGFSRTQPRSGPALLLTDDDGVIRHFRLGYHTESAPGDPRPALESFPVAIARAYAKVHPETRLKDVDAHGLDHDLVINFVGPPETFTSFSAGAVRNLATKGFWTTEKCPLRGKLVIVGGTYSAARDTHPTPAGLMSGVEIVATEVENLITRTAIGELDHYQAMALDWVVGIVFLYITWRFPGRMGLLVAVAAPIALSLLASWIAFHAFAFWFNFVPIMFGQFLHLKWEEQHEVRHLRHEVEQLRAKVAKIRPDAPPKPE